jgi:hypothetical protein
MAYRCAGHFPQNNQNEMIAGAWPLTLCLKKLEALDEKTYGNTFVDDTFRLCQWAFLSWGVWR